MDGRIDSREATKYKSRGVVLQLIATKECRTIAELSEKTGVSKMGITNMVFELEEMGAIQRIKSTENNGLGRKPQVLTIKPTAPKVIGILIFRERCEVVLCDMCLNILKRESTYRVPKNNNDLVDIIFKMVDEIKSNERSIAGIGVASIGPVDAERGVILSPYFFNEINNLPIADILKERYDLPVFLQQDNQCGALAEKLYGNGKESNNMLFLGVGKGIGCGMIVDSNLYDNRLHIAPEIGHISVERNGKQCVCGNRGCMEQYASVPVVMEKLRKNTDRDYSFEQFCRLAENDSVVGEIINEQIEVISTAIINTINILCFDTILLGYDGLNFTDTQIEAMQEYINTYKFEKSKSNTVVKRASFQNDAQLLGAACLVLLRIYQGEVSLYE